MSVTSNAKAATQNHRKHEKSRQHVIKDNNSVPNKGTEFYNPANKEFKIAVLKKLNEL